MERVSDWLNKTEFERFLKAKFYRVITPDGSELYDQLEARFNKNDERQSDTRHFFRFLKSNLNYLNYSCLQP